MIRICKSIHIVAVYSLEATYEPQEVFRSQKTTLPQKHIDEQLRSNGWEHRHIGDKDIPELYADSYFVVNGKSTSDNIGVRATYQLYNERLARRIKTTLNGLSIQFSIDVEGVGNWIVVDLCLTPDYNPDPINNIIDEDLAKISELCRMVYKRDLQLHIHDSNTSLTIGKRTYTSQNPIDIIELLRQFESELKAELVYTANQTPHLKILNQFECSLETHEEAAASEKMETFFVMDIKGHKTRRTSQTAPWLDEIQFDGFRPKYFDNSDQRWLFVGGRTQNSFIVNYTNRSDEIDILQKCARRMNKMQHVEQIVLRRLEGYLNKGIMEFRASIDEANFLQGRDRTSRCNELRKKLRVFEDALKDIDKFVIQPDGMTDISQSFIEMLKQMFLAEGTRSWTEDVARELKAWQDDYSQSGCGKG
jgi:hypothetical protein